MEMNLERNKTIGIATKVFVAYIKLLVTSLTPHPTTVRFRFRSTSTMSVYKQAGLTFSKNTMGLVTLTSAMSCHFFPDA